MLARLVRPLVRKGSGVQAVLANEELLRPICSLLTAARNAPGQSSRPLLTLYFRRK